MRVGIAVPSMVTRLDGDTLLNGMRARGTRPVVAVVSGRRARA